MNDASKADDGRSTLALTRRPGEAICIGPDVRVTYSVGSSGPRIMVEAPRDMPVRRESLLPDPATLEREAEEAAEQGDPEYIGPISTLVLGVGGGERVHLGRPGLDVELAISPRSADAARFAITAPRELTILRDELAEDLAAA
ncbi:carbon storage regulator [Thioalkalivibrio sp. ALMg11]|uniref:carbon storage regulator n=1 Tax=Thioalkalivibrio sp. ALMg11 TaxID=1158165 RepID=UPI0003642845|nr:carbon storage regulator [Thioalkalivibrio sp. ALMg11]